MRALLDVNVLIALLDGKHSLHERTRQWFTSNVALGWASCPITQNGCVRILATATYANAMPITVVVDRLREACSTQHHAFWPDDVSALQSKHVAADRLHGPRQLTDAYLLALAVRNEGRLVTLDAGIDIAAVPAARQHHLVTI